MGVSEVSLCFFISEFVGELPGAGSFSGGERYLEEESSDTRCRGRNICVPPANSDIAAPVLEEMVCGGVAFGGVTGFRRGQEGGAHAMGLVPCYKEGATRGLSAAGPRKGHVRPWPGEGLGQDLTMLLPDFHSEPPELWEMNRLSGPVCYQASQQPERSHAAPWGCWGNNVSCQSHSAMDTYAIQWE